MSQQFEARLAAGEMIFEPVAVVAAHPDDETLWIGSRLSTFSRLRLIHLTDGAPRDLRDGHQAGFETRCQYATARRLELYRALEANQSRPERCISLNVAEQESAEHLVRIVERLTEEIAGVRAVITHSYEHGHPDHDSAALAVHVASALLVREGKQSPHLAEFASYHTRDGELHRGEFWPLPNVSESVLSQTPDVRARKRRALRCFVSQASLVERYAPEHERVRVAPAYDFTQPAPPGTALYEQFGWEMTSLRWRNCARACLQHFYLRGAL